MDYGEGWKLNDSWCFWTSPIKRQLRKVNKWAPKMRKMSDEELKSQTKILQKQLADGKTVDQILPRAFAAMREADLRVLKMFPYDAQVMGGNCP